jgi:hypothetical protein
MESFETPEVMPPWDERVRLLSRLRDKGWAPVETVAAAEGVRVRFRPLAAPDDDLTQDRVMAGEIETDAYRAMIWALAWERKGG